MTFMSRRRKTCEPSGHVYRIFQTSGWIFTITDFETIKPISNSITSYFLSPPFTTTFTHLTHTHSDTLTTLIMNIDMITYHFQLTDTDRHSTSYRPWINRPKSQWKFSWVRSDSKIIWIHHTPRIENTRHLKLIPSNLSHDIRRSTNMAEDTQPRWPIQGGGTTTSPRCTRSDRIDCPGTPGTRMATSRHIEITTGYPPTRSVTI